MSKFQFYSDLAHKELVDEFTLLYEGSELKEREEVKRWLTVELIRNPYYDFELLVPIIVEKRGAYEIELDGVLTSWRRLAYLQTKDGELSASEQKEIALYKIKMCIAANPDIDIAPELSELKRHGIFSAWQCSFLLDFKESKLKTFELPDYIPTSRMSFLNALHDLKKVFLVGYPNKSSAPIKDIKVNSELKAVETGEKQNNNKKSGFERMEAFIRNNLSNDHVGGFFQRL